jgi:hypothetical protein
MKIRHLQLLELLCARMLGVADIDHLFICNLVYSLEQSHQFTVFNTVISAYSSTDTNKHNYKKNTARSKASRTQEDHTKICKT